MLDNLEIEVDNESFCPNCDYRPGTEYFDIGINDKKTNTIECFVCKREIKLEVETKLVLDTTGIENRILLKVEVRRARV